MKKISLLKAIKLCSDYPKLDLLKRKKLQDDKLKNIVNYAKANSPYYAKLYSRLPADFSLSDLPPVNKQALMEDWNNWPTDRNVTLEDINTFMQDLDNIGRKWQKKYLVFTTSGSTGHPLVSLCDSTTNNIMSALSITRSYARKQDLYNFIKKGGKSIGVFANGGFYLGNSSVRARLLQMPWKKKQMAITSALLPTEQIVAELNAFQPTMLGGYPSNLELLIDEQKSGRLHISPVIIMTGGEYLSDSLRKALADAFNCYVQTSYSSTEGGCIACECTEKHFHINDDWVIVEPVDRNNNPVPDGVLSDKILLTNLFNYTQPYIRYEVTDRVIYHHEPCACGNPSPWIELEGRNDDVVTFIENNIPIRIPPLAIYATLKEIHMLKRFQLVVHPNNQVDLRLEPITSISKEEAYMVAKNALLDFFKQYGALHVSITLSSELPKQHPISGKFKHIINLKD